MKSAAVTLLFLPLVATATELLVHGLSWHSDRTYGTGTFSPAGQDPTTGIYSRYEENRRPINNVNPGIGISFDGGWTAGIYRNSYYRTSVYLGRAWAWEVGPPLVAGRRLEVGAAVVAATGYQSRTGNAVQPGAAATLGLPITRRVTLRVIGAPGVGETSTVIHSFVGYRF